jgi:GT2 family glycosyltransferase
MGSPAAFGKAKAFAGTDGKRKRKAVHPMEPEGAGTDKRDEGDPGQVCLSVVMVNWNTRDLTLRCLSHLLGLGLPEETEIWVVDNGSTDGSAEAIRTGFPRVGVLENDRNLGFARANNRALTRCRGRYALLLNSDCFPKPDAVSVLLGAMEKDPGVGIAGGALLHPDGRTQNSFGVAPSLITELLPKGLLQLFFPARYPSKRKPPSSDLEVEAVLGAFLMVRRSAWERVGGLDEGYFFFLEETDWCLRMRQAGWKVVHVPSARAVHLQGQSAGKDPAGARVEFYRSRYRFFARHRGRWALRALRAGMLLKGLTNWFSSGLLGHMPWRRREGWTQRHRVDRTLLMWHLKGCPEDWGLPRG